jgi:antitoxin CptB
MGERDRIRWHCRRGLLELDLILESFFERHYDALDAGQQAVFGEMLDEADNDLLDWALGRGEPSNARYRNMVQLMRAVRV